MYYFQKNLKVILTQFNLKSTSKKMTFNISIIKSMEKISYNRYYPIKDTELSTLAVSEAIKIFTSGDNNAMCDFYENTKIDQIQEMHSNLLFIIEKNTSNNSIVVLPNLHKNGDLNLKKPFKMISLAFDKDASGKRKARCVNPLLFKFRFIPGVTNSHIQAKLFQFRRGGEIDVYMGYNGKCDIVIAGEVCRLIRLYFTLKSGLFTDSIKFIDLYGLNKHNKQIKERIYVV